MKITPIDLRKQEFRNALRGYDRHEVNAFLEMVANELDELLREHAALTERIRDQDGKIDDYRQMEKTLQETLFSAQKTVDELRKNAEKEAELILRNAKIEADGVVADARNEIVQLREEISSLRSEKEAFLAQFEGLIQAQKRFLSAYQERKEKEVPSLVGVFEKIE
ncbi:DivIVA domain-containing protein [candidate division TA06 bacterium]|nr:DivIVA domain-containing protein [candidate division TA06 bacterium]